MVGKYGVDLTNLYIKSCTGDWGTPRVLTPHGIRNLGINRSYMDKLCTGHQGSNIFIFDLIHSKDITLKRRSSEKAKQIFPEKELCALSPNFHIHVSVSDLYIPRWVCLFCRKICGPILEIYRLLTDTWMWKLGLGPRNSFPGNTCCNYHEARACC